MGMDKGVSDLLKALQQLQPTKQFFGCIVGGPEEDKAEYAAQAKQLGLTDEDILFTGNVDRSMVPTALSACDIAAMPWPDKPHYRNNMSPLKMFEYMAAQKPILTGDLPTIRDVLDESTATFCTPDSPESIAEQLQWMQNNTTEVQQKTNRATELVQRYSWKERTKRLLNLVLGPLQ